jgi:hypothetical protein
MELEWVEPHNCCFEIPVGCKVLRTKQKLPNPIELHHSKTITSVGPILITERRFTLINFSRVPYIGHTNVSKNLVYAFVLDGYIYVISKNSQQLALLERIMIRGIFEDPTALAELTACDGKPCWSPDDVYPLNQWMWEYIKPQILQQLLQKRQMPKDDNNNNNDDLANVQTQ